MGHLPPLCSSQRAKAPGSGSSSSSSSHVSLLRAGLRVALVALTAVAAMVLPNLEQMMSLLGAVTGSLLAVIFPVIIGIRCRLRQDWPKSELRDGSTPCAPGVGYSKTAALVVDLVILAAGVTSGLAGAVSVAPVTEY